MKKIIRVLPLLALFTLAGCSNSSVNVKPKNGTKVEAQEVYEALQATVETLNQQNAISTTVKKLVVDIQTKQHDIQEDNTLKLTTDMSIKAKNGVLTAALTGLKNEEEKAIGSAELKADVTVKGKATNEKTNELVDVNVSGKADVKAYVSEGNLYANIDEKTGKIVDDVAVAVSGDKVGVEWPAKYYFALGVDLKEFKIDYDLDDIMAEYNAMSDEEKAEFLFQKYSETSYSIYTKHVENKEDKDGDYLEGTTALTVEASVEFDTKKGITRAAFTVSNSETDTVYSELSDEEGFDASAYEASFLNQTIEQTTIKAQGEASFKYGSDVKVSLPDDLNTYLPFVLFK